MPKTKSTEGQYTISDLPQGSHSKPELRSAVFETEFFLTKCHCIVYWVETVNVNTSEKCCYLHCSGIKLLFLLGTLGTFSK